MITFNIGTKFKTRIAKSNIKASVIVEVSHTGDWETKCTVKDKEGNESEYLADELIGFGILEKANVIFDVIGDYYNSQDEHGNKKVLHGHAHITKNVRGGKETYRFWDDCRYASSPNDSNIYFEYEDRELTDKETIDILLEEILYGAQPDLQSSSLVGTSAKGIDKDPNYHNGRYLMPNDKEYTMTWCHGTIKIREGIDGGRYPGAKEVGKEIYCGEIDWNKYKEAKIRMGIRRKMYRGAALLKEYPQIEQIIYDDIKDSDAFKLNKEFDKK